jgi:hypothetical protein
MVEEPVVSVPVISSGSWMNEAAPAKRPKPNTPPPFLSQIEDDDVPYTDASPNADFFTTPAPSVAAQAVYASAGSESDSQFGSGVNSREPELVAAARPQFAEMAEEPRAPLPRDYAHDLGNGVRAPEPEPQPASALFTPAASESHRDLDTPAFLRRLRF